MKLTPSSRVYVIGTVLWLALTICSLNWADRGGPYFLASLAVAGVAYLLGIREFFAAPSFPVRVVVFGVALAALLQLQYLRLPPGVDDDIHRYVWDGRVQRLGYNPYLLVPSDPANRSLHTADTRNLNHPELTSPYPAGAQLFFRIVTAIHESTFALKIAFVICNFVIILVLLDVLRRERRSAHLVLAYAWNPLLAIEVAGSGHIDILGVLLLLVSFAALGRRWRATAAVALGVAIAVKFLPIVLLPLYWKRVRVRDALLAAVVAGLLYIPFVDHGRIPMGSLGTYVETWRFNDPVFDFFAAELPGPVVAGLAVLIGLLTAAWLRRRSPEWSSDLFGWPMAAALLCAPVVYPWYLLWLLPFLTSSLTLPVVIWTVSIIPVYMVWHLRALGRPWSDPGWIRLLEYGSVAIAGVFTALRRSNEKQELVDTEPDAAPSAK